MKRKGELVYDQVVALIIVAAVALVIIAWWIHASANITGDKEVEACRLSVTAYAKARLDVLGPDAHLFEIDCKRRVITFTEDRVELNGEKLVFYNPDTEKNAKKYSALTSGIVNAVAAQELATCWYQFLEGKNYWTNERDIGDDNTACFVCSELHFAPGVTYAAKPLVPYLQNAETRKYPLTVPGNDRPDYFSYLYEEPRICDHSGSSRYPRQVGESTVINERWYKEGDGSCERQFSEKILLGPTVFNAAGSKIWDPPLRDLTLAVDKSYRIVFFQLGKDEDEKDGKPTGTTYTPLIIPSERLDASLCSTFLG